MSDTPRTSALHSPSAITEPQCFLVVEHVSKTFPSNPQPVVALQDFSCTADTGAFLAVIGPSGCGKSSLLRIVAGLIKPTSGTVAINGKLVRGPGRDRGMVFQYYASFPWLTVRENVEFGLKIRHIPPEIRRVIANSFIEQVGLSGFEDAYPETLSGGMKQRVAIARTLANDPDMLIMDEPFGALDYQTRWAMQELLLGVWDQARKTILFVTHDIEEALFLADTVVIMTTRPGRAKRVLTVPFARPRISALKASSDFVTLKSDIIELVRAESSAPVRKRL